MEFKDFIAEQIGPLLKAKNRLPASDGCGAEMLKDFRKLSYCAGGFENYDSRAFMSQELSGGLAVSLALDKEIDLDALYSIRTDEILKIWGIERLIGCFTPSTNQALCSNDWWKSYPVEFLLENFKPWSVYMSIDGMEDSNGKSDPFGGFFAGFDYADGQVYFYIQQITKNGEWREEMLHLYPMKRGCTLGEVVDKYEFKNRDVAHLKTLFADGNKATGEKILEQLSHLGKAVANFAFPMVIAMMSDDMVERRVFEINGDSASRKSRSGSDEIPMRTLKSTDWKSADIDSDLCGTHLFLMRLKEEKEGGLN